MAAAEPTSTGGEALSPCPPTRNCVSSQANDAARHVEPIAFEGAAPAALARLKDALAALPRARIVREEGLRLYVECTSRVLRFVDDVELLVDPAASVIHVRSASRGGRYDFGVNRRRVEAIRRAFDARVGAKTQ